jgi:hypothetical protein
MATLVERLARLYEALVQTRGQGTEKEASEFVYGLRELVPV